MYLSTTNSSGTMLLIRVSFYGRRFSIGKPSSRIWRALSFTQAICDGLLSFSVSSRYVHNQKILAFTVLAMSYLLYLGWALTCGMTENGSVWLMDNFVSYPLIGSDKSFHRSPSHIHCDFLSVPKHCFAHLLV